MEKKWTVTGLLLLITAIILGAFGAHSLKTALLDPLKELAVPDPKLFQERLDLLAAYETAVRYQLINAVVFLIVPFIAVRFAIETKLVYCLTLIGTLLFSVSIYLLTIRGLIGMEGLKAVFGPLTPIGGSLMIAGWAVLLFRVVRKS